MVTGHQQMNQAGSEKKCTKSVSYEYVLNNYNYDDVSADQNSICENGKQGGWSASAYGKHSSNVGSVSNTEHVVGVAEVCSREAKGQLQPGASNSFEQSLLQKAWIYLQSIINTHMSACPRCNPRPPPDDESPSESTTQFFQRTTPSATDPSFMSSCHRTGPTCSRTRSPGHNDRPPCLRAFPPCPRAKPACPKAPPPCPRAPLTCPNFESPCPRASTPCPNFESSSPNAKSSKTSIYHKSCTDSLSDPQCPKAKSAYPDAKSRLNSSQTFKTKYHKDCHHSPFDSPSPKAKPPRLKAMPPHPNYKSNLLKSVSDDSLSDSSYFNLQSLSSNIESAYPTAEPICPNAKPVCQNSKPVCPNSKPVCPNAKPVCPNAKPVCPNAKPVCPNAKPVCPNAKPVCPNAKPIYSNSKPVCPNAKPVSSNSKPVCLHSKTVCSNSKTCLNHSFSNDSLPSSCKESLVEMAKVYLEKLTSEHKIKCPLCAKQCSYYSLETITSYLRGMLEQAWNYINTPAVQKSSESQRSQSICSNTTTNPGILKLPGSTKSKCSCAASKPKFPKPLSFESEGQSRCITCPTCLTRFSCPEPARLNFAPGLIKYNDDHDTDEGEEPTFPDHRSEEEGTHEHKSCYTHGCMHNSKSAQPSFNLSNTSSWSSKPYAKPVFIKSRQIKTPQSVEDLKASVTGISDKSSGNFYGYDVLDLRSTIEYARPCEQNPNVSKELICLTDAPTPKLVLNLTTEQKDVGSRPNESNHSRESLDNCKETISPCSDLKEPTCKEEALCPNQSCSEGSRKSEANHVDVIGEESGSMLRKQLSNKETISKVGHNSMTCIETIKSDRKDCTVQEKYNALRRDPHNYRYYY